MKKFRELLRRRWVGNAAALCVAVVVYLVLSHIGVIWSGFMRIVSYFSPVIGGCVIAYLMNPLAKLYRRTLFRAIRSEGGGWALSIFLAVITLLLLLTLILLTLVPQLVDSISTFVASLGGYAAKLQGWLDNIGLAATSIPLNLQSLVDSSENLLKQAVKLISDNSAKIISVSTSAGKGVFNWVIAFIMSIYLLAAKSRLKRGVSRLLASMMPSKRFDELRQFLKRCNEILKRYVIFNLIDSLIVGIVNAVFMSVMGMQYIGLVSFVVAVMNIVPTFGPFVGGVIGAFILLMVEPLHALMFIVFTLVLQLCDGYVIKPRLFGDSLGVSGLLILVSVVVLGRMFGVVGILVAIPAAAIVDDIYRRTLLPALERRRAALDEKTEAGPEPETSGTEPEAEK